MRPPPPRSPLWIALGAAISGVSTYALLSLAAAGLGLAAFDSFSLYWAILLVISVGGFLPLEQLVARRCAQGEALASLLGWVLRWGGATAAVSCGLVLVVLPRVSDGIEPTAVVALAVNLAAVGPQAALRGAAAGQQRFDVYAAVVICDSVVRTGACGVLALAGVGAVSAYAAVIALGAVSSVLLGASLLARGPQDPPPLAQGTPHAPAPGLTGEALALVPAMVSMQLLLNSTVLTSSGPVSAGQVLAISSLVRTAVFLAQAAQAAYVGRIAALVHEGSAKVRRATLVVSGAAVGLASATVAGSALLGPTLVRLLYGPEYVLGRSSCVLAGLGVAVFVVAIVANDLAVARGVHRRAGAYWMLAVLAALGVAVVLPAGELRTFAPILVGSTLALALTLLGSRTATPTTQVRTSGDDVGR